MAEFVGLRASVERERDMFVGHFGVGFGVKCLAPKTSLGTLVLSAMLADLLLFVFVAMGIEHIAIQPDIPRVDALDLYDLRGATAYGRAPSGARSRPAATGWCAATSGERGSSWRLS